MNVSHGASSRPDVASIRTISKVVDDVNKTAQVTQRVVLRNGREFSVILRIQGEISPETLKTQMGSAVQKAVAIVNGSSPDGSPRVLGGHRKTVNNREINAKRAESTSIEIRDISYHIPTGKASAKSNDIVSDVPLEEAQVQGDITQLKQIRHQLHTLDVDLKTALEENDFSKAKQLQSQMKQLYTEFKNLSSSLGVTSSKTTEIIEASISRVDNLSMFKKLNVDEKNVVFHDYTDGKKSGMFEIGNAIKDVENTFDAMEGLGPVEIKEKCIAELSKIPIPQRANFKSDKEFKEAMKKTLNQINKVKANAFFQAAQALGISTKALEEKVNKYNSKFIGTQTVITKYELDGVTYYDVAQPKRETMHTSADRSVDEISNSFNRSIYKLDAGGRFVPIHSGIQTNSSLPTISVGEMRGLEATRSDERHKGAITAFKQLLGGLKPQKDENGRPLTDGEGHRVIKFTNITLFTAAIERFDKFKRGMDSEFQMLGETSFLYDLYDGQLIEIEHKDGTKELVRVEIEHMNAGSNVWATRPKFLERGMEKNINDKAMCKISSDVEKRLYPKGNPNIPPELKAKRESCQKNIDAIRNRNANRLAELRGYLENANSDEEFKAIKKEAEGLNNELKAAYSELAKVEKDIFNATLKNEKEILRTEEIRNGELIENKEQEIKYLELGAQQLPLLQRGPHLKRIQQLKNEIQKLKTDFNIRRLHLEIQDLYHNEKFRSPETLHNLQTALALLGELRNQNVGINCKSGNDRTGRACNVINLAWITYEKTGKFPEFSPVFQERGGIENPNQIFRNADNHKRMHLFGAAAKVAGQNKPGSEFLQVTDDANPELKGIASVLNDCGVVKKAWQMAAELEGVASKEQKRRSKGSKGDDIPLEDMNNLLNEYELSGSEEHNYSAEGSYE